MYVFEYKYEISVQGGGNNVSRLQSGEGAESCVQFSQRINPCSVVRTRPDGPSSPPALAVTTSHDGALHKRIIKLLTGGRLLKI